MKPVAASIGVALLAQRSGFAEARQPCSPRPRAVTKETPKAPAIHLTPRQLEVLELLCEGLPNKLICRRLNVATGTVKVHISCILRELGVASRLEAVVMARRYGLVGEPAPARTGQAEGPLPGRYPPAIAERHAFGRWEEVVAF